MLEERRKAEIITYEMLEYFFDQQAQHITSSVEFDTDGTSIKIEGTFENVPENLEELVTFLNIERNYDLEDYYDGLFGSHHELEDYTLVGMLTDEVIVNYDEPVLQIELFRSLKKRR